MSTQTVYFNDPADIVNLQNTTATQTTQISSMSGSISSLNTTTTTQTTQITSMSGSIYSLRAHENDLGKNYGKFLHGVMSGDPTSTSVILSTNLTFDKVIQDTYHVYCMVSTGILGDFSNPETELNPNTLVSKALIRVSKSLDYNAKVRIAGLTANTQYYYKFYSIVPAAYSQVNQQYLLNQRGSGAYNEFVTETFYDKSPVGRFRTLPIGSVSNVRFAAINCQNISCGFFNHMYQMSKIAQAGKLDYLLTCGDLYYQDVGTSRADFFFKEMIDANGMKSLPQTYEQFCQIFKVYKQDPDWQECMRSLSLIYLWDDHDAVRDGWMVNPNDNERLVFADGFNDYNVDGSYWAYLPGAINRNRPSKVDGKLQLTENYLGQYVTGPLDNTYGMLKRATRAWYDSNPVDGTYFASNSTNSTNVFIQNDPLYISQINTNIRQFLGTTEIVGYPNWTSTGGLAPLDKTYKFGDLVSIHMLDDMSQNYVDPKLLNPYYNNQWFYHPLYPPMSGTYTLIPNPSGPFTTVFIPPVGSVTGCSSMPLIQNYGSNTGAFVEDLKKVVLYNNYVSCTRKGIMEYQMTGLYNAMTGAGTKWKVILTGMRGGLTSTNPLSDGQLPPSMSNTIATTVFTDSLGYYSSTYYMTGAVRETCQYLAQANRELYATGAVDYPLVYWKDANFQKQKRNGLMLTELLSNFNNCIVLAGDKHDHYVSNMHSPSVTASIFEAGRNATGIWNNYTTGASGAVNNLAYPVVAAYFSPQHNSIGELTESGSLRSQSTREKILQNASQDIAKYQDPRIVDFNYNFLNNLKGFTLFDVSSTGCDSRYFFVGGYDVGNTSLAPINFIVPGGNGIIPGLDAYNKRTVYRDNVLQLSCQYRVPFNTGAFQGTAPIQIVKPTVKWSGYDFLPNGYPYKIPVNCTTSSDFVNYNTPITISQL